MKSSRSNPVNAGELREVNVLERPFFDEVMRDRHRDRRGEAVWMAAFEQGSRLMAREPTRVLKLDLVDLERPAPRMSEAANHQRGWKRPGLRGEVAHRVAFDAGLLENLAPDRRLDRLAGLHESRQRRIHAFRKAWLTSEQAGVAVDREHDHDGIRARKVMHLADRAFAAPAGRRDHGFSAAVRAEAAPCMPVHERFR